MRHVLSLLCLFGLLGSPAWSAEPASPLFRVTVPGNSAVLAAEQQGLALLLQRLTGGQIDLQQPDVAKGVEQVGTLVRQVTPGDGGLTIDFAPEGVKRLIAASGAPYWEQPRPALIFWLVDAQLSPVPLVPGDPSTVWPALFTQEGNRWALRSSFPLMDLDDLTLVNADLVNQGLMPSLLKASARYGEGLLVRGSLSQGDDGWLLQWHLHAGDGKGEALINGQAQGTPEAVVAQTMAAISHYLAERYGQKLAPGAATDVTAGLMPSGEYQLVVEGVKSVDDLLALQGVLRQLSMISKSNVASMAGDRVTLSLALSGKPEEFVAALQTQPRLKVIAPNNSFHLQWQQP